MQSALIQCVMRTGRRWRYNDSDLVGLDRFHIGAAKVACPIALRPAARHPDRVRTLTVLGGIVSGAVSVGRAASWLEHIDGKDVETTEPSPLPSVVTTTSGRAARRSPAPSG